MTRAIEDAAKRISSASPRLADFLSLINALRTAIETEAEKVTANIADLETRLDKTQSQQADDGRNIQRQQKDVERYLAKRQLLFTKRDECNNKIRSLGVLPEEAFEKYIGQKAEKVRSSPPRSKP